MKLNADGSAEFGGSVNIKHSTNENGLKFETSGTITETTSSISFNENQNELYGFMLKYEASSDMFKMIRKHNSSSGTVVMSIGRESNDTTFSGSVISNAIKSSTNTDLKIESNGSGDIRLIATPNDSTTGYIHLCRANAPTERFNTIAYSVNGNSSYISMNVHYTAGNNTLTREVLKLNSNLSSEFWGSVSMKQSCSIQADSGYGNIEIGGPSGGYIDLKSPFSDDYDFRIITTQASTGLLSKSIITMKTADVLALTIDTSQNSTFVGNVNTPQLVINTVSAIYDSSPSDIGTDLRANLRVISNLSTASQDGMYLNYGSTGGAAAHCRLYANGTTQRMFISASTGNVGIGNESPTQALDVTGSIYASLNLDCTGLTGGRNNLANNFHIDNYSNSGEMYINYSNQRNIQIGKDYLTLFDLSNGTIKNVVQQTGTGLRAVMDFFRKATATSSEISVGRIECNSSNTFYRTDPSDSRLKENIKDIENHFHILDKLKPCNFKYKSCDEIRDGFIADDLYEVYPICVSGKPGELNEDGSGKYMMVDTKPLIPILTKCLQGNRQEIKDLKKNNKDLVDKMFELEMKLNLVMTQLNL